MLINAKIDGRRRVPKPKLAKQGCEFNLYLSYDAILSLFSTASITLCIYLILMVFQSEIVPLFSMPELPGSFTFT